jgi:hypothetical protein
VKFKKTAALPSSEEPTRGVMAMSHKGSSHIGLYLSTLELEKVREFYEAFWALISDHRPITIKEGGRIPTGADPQDRLDGSPPFSFRESIVNARNDRSNQEGILLPRVIECPVCGERAHSFRIRRVTDLRTIDGEFYHRTATCSGSITPDMPAAMDLLRLTVEGVA